jgi:hypothetical protein
MTEPIEPTIDPRSEPRADAPTEPPVDAQAESPAPLSLIYLDVDDEITSAAARIRAAGADEVALVLPFGSRLATSRINFRLLAREAAFRGKRLEVIAADASARALSEAAGLPTYASVAAFEARRAGAAADQPREANGTETRAVAPAAGIRGAAGAARAAAAGAASAATARVRGAAGSTEPGTETDTQTTVLTVPRRKAERVPVVGPPRPPVRRGLAIGVALALVIAIIGGAFAALELLPSATVTLHPRSEPIGPLELSVEAREDVTAPDATSMTIPARRFTFPLQATQTFAATGTHVEDTKATGTVTFSNFDTGGGVLIPKGSIVRTDSTGGGDKQRIEFVTTAEVTLPRAQIDFFPPFPVHPSTSDVGIQAVEAGPAGNVGSNTIVDVKGGNRNLFVTNAEPTTGGAHDEVAEVSADDVDAAKAALAAALVAQLDQRVSAKEGVPPEITLFPSTSAVGEPDYSVDPKTLVGQQVDEFDLAVTADGTALGVDPAPIRDLAGARLAGQVTTGWTILPGSVASTLGTPAVLGTSITYPVSAGAMQVRDVDEAALLAAIRGLALPEARSKLDDFGDVAIEVWPDWVTRIPTRPDRVTMVLAQPQPSATP